MLEKILNRFKNINQSRDHLKSKSKQKQKVKQKVNKITNNKEEIKEYIEYINFNNKKIEIIRKNRQKNIYIKVLPPKDNLSECMIKITCSKSVSQKYLKQLLENRWDKILLNIQKVSNKYKNSSKYNISGLNKGDEYYIFGEKHILEKDYTLTELEKKYKKILYAEILKYGEQKAIEMNVSVLNWTIRKMKTRWGSCNISKKRICINLELVKRDKSCLEYVIVHELAHLLEKNHNKRFYSIVYKYYPNYIEVEKVLKLE